MHYVVRKLTGNFTRWLRQSAIRVEPEQVEINMDILSTAIQVNLSTIIFACIAGIVVWRFQHAGKIRFSLGLSVVCLSGLLAIPATEYFQVHLFQ